MKSMLRGKIRALSAMEQNESNAKRKNKSSKFLQKKDTGEHTLGGRQHT
jgi:hypothetical protein